MKEELKTLIQQHLPALAAGEMKTYIENCESDRVQFEDLKTKTQKIYAELDAANSKITDLKSREVFKFELEAKEKLLNKQEYNLRVAELEYQLKAEKESKDSIFRLVQTFVQNPRAIEVITKSKSYQHQTDHSPSGGITQQAVLRVKIENQN